MTAEENQKNMQSSTKNNKKPVRDEAFWADYYRRLEERGREADRVAAAMLVEQLKIWFPEGKE